MWVGLVFVSAISSAVAHRERWILAWAQEFRPKGIGGEDRERSVSWTTWGHSSLCVPSKSLMFHRNSWTLEPWRCVLLADRTRASRVKPETSSSWEIKHICTMLSNDIPLDLLFERCVCFRRLSWLMSYSHSICLAAVEVGVPVFSIKPFDF